MNSPIRKFTHSLTVAHLIDLVSEPIISVTGDDSLIIKGTNTLNDGVSGSVVFCKAKGLKARELIKASKASVIITAEGVVLPKTKGKCYLQVADPARWFVRVLQCLFPDPANTGIHTSAIVEDNKKIGQNTEIGPGAVIENGAVIGEGCRVGAGTFIGKRVILGAECDIGPNCSLGVSGLAVEYDDDGMPLAYPHLGDVVLGDRVRLGANCVIVRGIIENTLIGDNSQVGNMVNIGHNCSVEKNCWISAKVLLCGSVTLNEGVMVGAGATLNNHITVGAGASIGLGSVVTKSVAIGQSVFGVPAKPLPTMRPFK